MEALLLALGVLSYVASHWRLFIDASKRSLKAVLLHNGNRYTFIPLAHTVHLREAYESIKTVLNLINYKDHGSYICVDIKMVNILLGQQSGFTKYPCFLCYWDSRDRENHWTQKDWQKRNSITVGDKNIINEPLVDRKKMILPPLHLKLGFLKQFVKALDFEGDCFLYTCNKFKGLSKEKLQAGVFDGPQIRKLIKDKEFTTSMDEKEKKAWNSFVAVCQNFLGNKKSENYKELIDLMLSHFCELGCYMSIKIHYINSHLDVFPENLGDMSDEQGERFHQDIRVMEERYQGVWDVAMCSDYSWSLKRDCPQKKHSKKSTKRSFLPLK